MQYSLMCPYRDNLYKGVWSGGGVRRGWRVGKTMACLQ